MGNNKKDSLLKFIEGIQEPKVIDAISDLLESDIFVQQVQQKAGLIPVWVVFNIYISQMGHRYTTSILKAFRSKMGVADYIYNAMMADNKSTLDTKVIFIDKDSSKLYYSLYKNSYGYYNYRSYYKNEAASRTDSGEELTIKEVELE